MDAKEIYRKLQSLVDRACRQHEFLLAIDGARALGMAGGQTGRGDHTLDYDFKANDESGAQVQLLFHSYDQSKAFSIKPNMNKFDVTLTHPTGVAEVHKNQYEG